MGYCKVRPIPPQNLKLMLVDDAVKNDDVSVVFHGHEDHLRRIPRDGVEKGLHARAIGRT